MESVFHPFRKKGLNFEIIVFISSIYNENLTQFAQLSYNANTITTHINARAFSSHNLFTSLSVTKSVHFHQISLFLSHSNKKTLQKLTFLFPLNSLKHFSDTHSPSLPFPDVLRPFRSWATSPRGAGREYKIFPRHFSPSWESAVSARWKTSRTSSSQDIRVRFKLNKVYRDTPLQKG